MPSPMPGLFFRDDPCPLRTDAPIAGLISGMFRANYWRKGREGQLPREGRVVGDD